MSLRLFARRLASLPSHQVVRVPPTGHITAVKIKPGDKVNIGDAVAEMSTFTLTAHVEGVVAKTFLQQGCAATVPAPPAIAPPPTTPTPSTPTAGPGPIASPTPLP